MKTSLLYAAMLLSPAVFAQDANVKSSQAVEVKSTVKANDQSANANASASVNSATAIQAGRTTVNATKQTAIEAKTATEAKVQQQKAAVTARTENTVANTNRRIAKTKISTDIESTAGVSASSNNKLNAAASANSAASVSTRTVKASGSAVNDVATKTGKVHASTNSAVKSAAVVKPRPVVASRIAATNSTLLKIK